MTDPENRFHALKFAISTCVGKDPNYVVATANFYLAFLEGLTQIRPEQPSDAAEPDPIAAEPVDLADHAESYADEPVDQDRATPGWMDVMTPFIESEERRAYGILWGKETSDIHGLLDASSRAGSPDAPEKLADDWAKHHEDFLTRYGLSQGQITEPVLETGVAEKPQVVVADEQ